VKRPACLSVLIVMATFMGCSTREPHFAGTWKVRSPAADSLVTFVVSGDAKSGYSVSGETLVEGGLLEVGFRIEDVRVEGEVLKFRITSGIPVTYALHAVNEDTLAGELEIPDAPPGAPTEVLLVRANP
jgi:hypothetical protein